MLRRLLLLPSSHGLQGRAFSTGAAPQSSSATAGASAANVEGASAGSSAKIEKISRKSLFSSPRDKGVLAVLAQQTERNAVMYRTAKLPKRVLAWMTDDDKRRRSDLHVSRHRLMRGDGRPAPDSKVRPTPRVEPERFSSNARFRNAPMSVRKLNEMCRLVRGVGVDEALLQLKFCGKGKAWILYNTLRNARIAGVNNFGLDPERLVVFRACVGPAVKRKKVWFRGKGKVDFRTNQKANLFVTLVQVPEPDTAEERARERRVGKRGMTKQTMQRTLDRLKQMHDQDANRV